MVVILFRLSRLFLVDASFAAVKGCRVLHSCWGGGVGGVWLRPLCCVQSETSWVFPETSVFTMLSALLDGFFFARRKRFFLQFFAVSLPGRGVPLRTPRYLQRFRGF